MPEAPKQKVCTFVPKIVPLIDMQASTPIQKLYIDAARNNMGEILSCHNLFMQGNEIVIGEKQREEFHALLPMVSLKKCHKAPGHLSFYSLSKYRASSFKFFFNMLSCWLLPGKRLDVVLLYAVDFRMPEISNDVYTVCEVAIHVEDQAELDQILQNFPIIESEILLGMPSTHYAQRILETRGLTMDIKTALILEHIAFLIKRLPEAFDHDLITEMQHVLVMCPEEFKAARGCRHISRLISILYLFRRSLNTLVKAAPQKRHLSLKFFQARVSHGNGQKQVLAVIVGINFFRDKEVFEKTHLLKAIQNYIPNAQAVEGSFFINRRGSEHNCTLYMELEKTNGEVFTGEEIRKLRKELRVDLKDRIEYLLHPIFMSRNEEEVIRNILSLSSQIKYLRDIPQVFITFDEQTHANLFYTVILVRVMRPEALSIQEMFKQTDTIFEYIHDRSQNAGSLRRKYKKEATVFRLKLPKEPFMRLNHSIDLNKARQAVVEELYRIVGEVRDFNGGMISKQNEVLFQLRSLMQNGIKYNDILLENFFYSLTPVIVRSVLEPDLLQILFLMLMQSVNEGHVSDEISSLKVNQEGISTFVMIKSEGRGLKEEMQKALAKLQVHSSQLAHSYVSDHDTHFLGYILRSDDPEKQQQFCHTVKNTLSTWENKKRLSLSTN